MTTALFRNRGRRSGLTLLETLAALTLAALLLTMLFLVLGSLVNSKERIDAIGFDQRSELVRSVIARDLITCQSIDIRSEVIVLHGYSGRDRASGLANSALTVTEYRIVEFGSERQLVREQYQSIDGEVILSDRRVLANQVLEMRLQVPTSDSATWRNLVDRTQRIDGLLVPSRLRLCVYAGSQSPLCVAVVRPGESE